MLSTRNLLFSNLLVLALILTGWSIYLTYDKKATSMNAAGNPDAFMEDVAATVIDSEGSPVLKITASKMVHYAQNDSTDIVNPWVTLYRKTLQPWQLMAKHAKSLQGTKQIILWDNVTVNHPGDEQNQKTTLHTPTLIVYPSQQIAMTQDPVIITQPNTIIHAVGLSANLATGAVKLLSEAKGEFNVQN